ncbi:hypothetical protein P691DRAFT_809424 [Macrolepiota fuliginosa MF-IS2]|uniref:Uncharacterized protein n=1 Tax=Macrolepiota fuliginosa MF-IS2 TaxID=1400762 RepID=A0A9P5X3T7_9AGAR|nr:hypothetical protein P691DRAFT_809424 [Macrolepiota fuliginosa MF-IS2]
MESSKLPEDNVTRVDDVAAPTTNVTPPEETERSAGDQEGPPAASDPSSGKSADEPPSGKDKEPSKTEPSNTDDPDDDDDWPEFGGGQPRATVVHPSGTGAKQGGGLKPG